MPTISPDGCEEKCHDPVLVSIVKKHHGWITKVCCSRICLYMSPHCSEPVVENNYA